MTDILLACILAVLLIEFTGLGAMVVFKVRGWVVLWKFRRAKLARKRRLRNGG